LHHRLSGDDRARRLFLREAEVARSVEPYCTARVLDADIAGDRPYIVSEFVEGESLHDLVKRTGPRDPGGLERLAIGTAAALKGIHQAGIVHRDFKPGNVLLGPDGPRVVDFGIARIVEGTSTMSSGILGTPAYMSPEQISAGTIGPPSDIFSWAVTMVYAATGRPAFGQDSIPAVLHRVLNEQADLNAIPPRLRELVAACLAKQPEHRPTAADLLGVILGHGPQLVPAPRTSPVPQPLPVPQPPPVQASFVQPPPGPPPRFEGYVPAQHGPPGSPGSPVRFVSFIGASVVQFAVFLVTLFLALIAYYSGAAAGVPVGLLIVVWLAVGLGITVRLRRRIRKRGGR
jgi:eukaryotic-like serine/threonine-protein kinase